MLERPSRLWIMGPRIRLDSLKPGDAFLDFDGKPRTLQGDDGNGTCRVKNENGDLLLFAGCSEVVRFD